MNELAADIAIGFFGAAIGWIVLFSGFVAPIAFSDMDHGRANRHVRRVMKGGHGVLAMLCFIGAGAAAVGGGVGGAALGAIAGAMLLLCQWALAPREDDRPPPGGKRKLQTARIVAAGLTAAMAPLLLVALGLAAAGV